jgi:hypothetical protein
VGDGTPKLTDATRATILDWLRRGHYRKVACAKVRITERTLQRWRQWGEAGEEPYASFLVEMDEAEADCENELLTAIRTAQPGVPGVSGADVWTSRAWVMERRWPKRWRGSVRLTVHEEVETMTARLKSDAELYRRVVERLSVDEEHPGEPAPGNGAH